MGLRRAIETVSAGVSRWGTNGPLRAAFAVALESVDDRRGIVTPHGAFTVRVGNALERWRADTLLDKEPETIAWLDRTISADSVFYDVGANIGVYSCYALHMFPGRVRAVCFEPEALNFARLNQNLHDNGWSDQALALPAALGEGLAIGNLRLSRFQAGRALHGERHVEAGRQDHRVGCIVLALDEIVERAADLPPPSHLKIDVDGPELAVLRGASGVLSLPSLRHLLIELDEPEVDEAGAILSGHGFRRIESGRPEGGMRNVVFEKPA